MQCGMVLSDEIFQVHTEVISLLPRPRTHQSYIYIYICYLRGAWCIAERVTTHCAVLLPKDPTRCAVLLLKGPTRCAVLLPKGPTRCAVLLPEGPTRCAVLPVTERPHIVKCCR